MKQNSLAIVVIAGLVGFLWPLAHWMQKIDTWENAWNPPGVGEFILCICFGLVAIAAALGMDIKKFLAGIGVTIGSPEPAAPATLGDPKGSVRTSVLAVLVLVCAVTFASCTVFRAFVDRPPRAVVTDILVAMEWSVAEAHSVEWLSADDVAQFTRIDHTVRDTFAANPDTPTTAVTAAIRAFIANNLSCDSRLIPYLVAVMVALRDTSPWVCAGR